MNNSVHYKSGSKNDIAVVLSCPGQDEESADPPGPAMGQTGKNLEKILEILTSKYGHLGFTRDEICITNAWDQVEYPDKTNRSEAKIAQILSNNNLDRLASEVSCIDKIIICCGVNATASVLALSYAGKLNQKTKVLFFDHIGNQSLNSSIKYDLDGNVIKTYSKAKDKPPNELRSLEKIMNDNRILRLEVIAHQLNLQISGL